VTRSEDCATGLADKSDRLWDAVRVDDLLPFHLSIAVSPDQSAMHTALLRDNPLQPRREATALVNRAFCVQLCRHFGTANYVAR
jgi:hypothetical protein